MDRIVDYTIISASDLGALTEWVVEHLDEGWQPLGGVCLAYERNIHRTPKLFAEFREGLVKKDKSLPNDFEHYAQALVKYGEEKDDG